MAEAAETKLCNNCKKQISANNFMMHEMHCKRHIGLCKQCKEPFPHNEMEAHFQESHAKIKCPKCSVEVEIMHLEDHEENDCAKKPMHCIYCELEFAKCELQAHINYCGSRTEPCHKCGAFIMLKDQIKHDKERCEKQEVSIKNSNRADAAMNRHVNNDPFNMDEMARILRQEPAMRDSDGGAGAAATGRNAPPPKRPLQDKRPAPKVNNGKPDLNNKKRDNTTRQSTESEYDRLLAAQLASDLNSTQDFMRAFEKPQSPLEYDTGPGTYDGGYDVNTFTADDVTIPCEFCGQLCTMDDLVEHQSGCSLDRISSMLPTTGKNNGLDVPNSYRTSPNNDTAVFRDIQSPLVQQHPGIIDNLRNFTRNQWEDDIFASGQGPTEGEDGDMPLPCEFCLELFPMDNLVQHQAMCEHNRTETPRPPSPKTRPKKRNGADRLASEFPNLNSRRNQPPSSLYSNDNSDDDTRPLGRPIPTKPGPVHKVQKPKPSVVKNGASYVGTAKPALSSDTSATSPSQETRTMLRKYGVQTTDRGDYFTRQGVQPRKNSDSNTDSWLQTSTNDRRAGSGARTRSTLDNLLNDADDTSSSHDLLGHIGAGQGSRKREINPTRQNVTVSQANPRVPAKVKTSARDVQRELTSSRPTGAGTNGTAPPKNRSSRGFEVRVRPVEADETSDIVTGSRQARSRANHVFNKPTTTRKKADNR